MKIVVTAGGTMGHINPALAIIDEFKKREKELEILYIGTHNRMEKDIIPKKGIPYESIEIYGFSKNMMSNIKNFFLVQKAYKKCLKILSEFKPDIVIGVGGYVTYPVLKAAHKLHLKTFIHEQNSIPGKSNLMISKYADIVGITFESSASYFKHGKVINTGNPCGVYATRMPEIDKETLGLHKEKKLVTFAAGSLGSGSLNDKMISFLKDFDDDYEIVYITGKTHYDSFPKNMPSKVKILPYFEDLPKLLKVSDVIVSRAGSGSLCEILALKKCSIVIPSPNVANNHQYLNAKELYDKGCIELIEEKNITENLLKEKLNELLNDSVKREKLINNMSKENTLESGSIIYNAIKGLL